MVPVIPNNLGNWVEVINKAIPAKKPVKTVLEINLTMNPNLKTQEIRAKTPAATATSETIIKYESERLVIESQLNTEYLVNKRLERQITHLKTCPECSRVNEKVGFCGHCRGDV